MGAFIVYVTLIVFFTLKVVAFNGILHLLILKWIRIPTYLLFCFCIIGYAGTDMTQGTGTFGGNPPILLLQGWSVRYASDGVFLCGYSNVKLDGTIIDEMKITMKIRDKIIKIEAFWEQSDNFSNSQAGLPELTVKKYKKDLKLSYFHSCQILFLTYCVNLIHLINSN